MMVETWIDSIYHPPKAVQPWRLEELIDCRIRYYSSGRWALTNALKALGIGAGDTVLLPGFICRDLLAAVHEIGGSPKFYPVSEKMELAANPAELPRAKAIIAVNYFGFPQDLAPFREYRKRTSAWVIEDNAHGLFSRDTEGHWLGLRCDLGVFSLRKSMALPNGAALVSRRGAPFALPDPLPFAKACGLRCRLKRSFRRASNGWDTRRTFKMLERFRRFKTNGSLGDDTESRIPMPPEPCLELDRSIDVADPQLEVARRRWLYALCEEILKPEGVRPIFSDLPRHVSPYGYPFSVEPGKVSQIQKKLGAHGLRCLPWPDLPSAIEPEAPPHYRHVRVVHFLW